MTLRFPRVLLVVALALAVSGCAIDLQHNLTEQDANEIYVLLTKNGIPATKVLDASGNEPTYVIRVGKADAAQAAELMRENSLPRPPARGFDEFRKNKGMIPTQTEERAMLLEAMGGEVSSALNKVDGVLESRAIINIPDNNDLTQSDKRSPTTASVFVKFRATGDGKAPVDEARIRAFVATALPDTKPENVSVLMTLAQPVNTEPMESRFQSILGMQIANQSVRTFQTVMFVMAALVLAMAGLTGFFFLRGSGAQAPRAPVRRRPTEE